MKTNKIGSYRIGILLAGFAIMLLLADTAMASNELTITNLAISPQPVYSGQNITISFQLYNNYGSIQNIALSLSGNYPLLNYSPSSTQLISSMSQGLYNNHFVYHIRIPSNLQSGTYTVSVTASYELTSSTTSSSSNIPISFYISGTPGIALSANPTSAIVPGSQFGVDITALNSGTAEATNASITLLSSANFSVVGASKFNLGPMQAGASATAVATLQAGSTLPQGTSSVPILLKYTGQYGQNVSAIEYVPLSIVVNQPNLVPSIVSTQPQLLYSGSNQTMTVAIQNIGTGVAKNVSIRFLSTPYLTVGGSASDIFVGSIQPGTSSTQSVFVVASRGDNLTSYSLPAALTYSNANYQNQVSTTKYINVSLEPSARYNVTMVSDALYPGGTYLPVTFTIKNTGSEAAQQATLSLQTIYPVSPVNPNVYVNNLAPGESANVTFYVSVDAQGNAGQYPVTLYEQWTQPNGASSQLYSGSNNYYAIVYSSSSGASSSPFGSGIIVAIIIIAASVIAYRMYGKRGQSKKTGK